MSLVDVDAPCQEIFDIVVNIHQRMQLSPLWGLSHLLEVSSNYPNPGSSYRVRILPDVPHGLSIGTLNSTQSVLAGLNQLLSLKSNQADTTRLRQSKSEMRQDQIPGKTKPPESNIPAEQEYFVQEYQPPHKFSYYRDRDRKTVVTWRFQKIPYGTRINYEEIFNDENIPEEEFIPTVQMIIREWLANIKRYSELHDGRSRKLIKWFLDRFYLKLRPDQRRIVQMMLLMHIITLSTFLIAIVGYGFISLIF